MTDEPKKDRSPNYPKLPLEQAVEVVRQFHKRVGKSKMKREAVAGALGYSGLSGASLTTIGALNQYGLIVSDESGLVSITPLAVNILHPTDERQEQEAKMTAALTPKVFNILYTEGFHHATEQTISNNLIQNGFTPDGASRAASVYLQNISFTHLNDDGIRGPSDSKKDDVKARIESGKMQFSPVVRKMLESDIPPSVQTTKRVLAKYSIPIGSNEATLEFTGSSLSEEDFDALIEYIEIFKRQLKRRQELEAEAMKGARSMKDAAINLANLEADEPQSK